MRTFCHLIWPESLRAGITIAVSLVWASPGWAQTIEEGRLAYFAGQFDRAFEVWEPLARAGEADAQYYLGILFSEGRLGLMDDVESGQWALRAALQDHPLAAVELGVLLELGVQVPGEEGTPDDWFQLAAENLEKIEELAEEGDPFAQMTLGVMYQYSWGVEEDLDKALRWHRNAANQGFAQSQYHLAEMFDEGHGVELDDVEAARLFRLAAMQDLVWAQVSLGLMFEYAEGLSQNMEQAEYWYKKASAAGSAQALLYLGQLYVAQGRYDEAEPHYKRSLEINERALGPDHLEVANVLYNLADLYDDLGRYSEAEQLYNRDLQISEQALGTDHIDLAIILFSLAEVYSLQSRYDEAEPLYRRDLQISEQALGPDSPEVAVTLIGLGSLYDSQGRYDEAELLYRRSLSIFETSLGPDHIDVAIPLNNLAVLYHNQERLTDANLFYERSLEISEDALGPDHPAVATILNNIALVYLDQGLYTEAETLLARSLAIREGALGVDHPDVAYSLYGLATLYVEQGRYREAEPLFLRDLAITLGAFGPGHPEVVGTLMGLATLNEEQGRYDQALRWSRQATTILRDRFAGAETKETPGLLSELKGEKWRFYQHVDLALHPEQRGDRFRLEAEAFEVVQMARSSTAAGAVARMAARFASGDTAVASLVRGLQDLTARHGVLDQKLIQSVSAAPDARNKNAESRLRSEIGSLEAQITDFTSQIDEQFPRYSDLTRREPLSLFETQALLGPDEALLTFSRSGDGDKTHVFVVRQARSFAYTVDLGVEELDDAVAELRAGINLENAQDFGNIPPFDTTLAFELYETLLSPSERQLGGVKHLFVVPGGALQSIPLGILVTSAPRNDPRIFEDYRDVSWLAKKYALTTLPSVASLRAFRVFASRTEALNPFLGIGDPLLEGGLGASRGISVSSLFRGPIADVEAIRDLPSLPGTAEELSAIASYFEADPSAIYTQSRATETLVKSLPLFENRVIAFATHALISGEIRGLVEPALVLTPPTEGTELDDGSLTASEIALLKLDADWVILSACNTALGANPGAEGLSGLASAFFYAGARSLLVSHWRVESKAATALTVGIFEELAADPDIGRAEALRRSMLALALDEDHPHYAHPAFWAPFVIVGVGSPLASSRP